MRKLLIILFLSISFMLFADVILYDEPYTTNLENGNIQVSVTVMQGVEDISNAFFYYRVIGKNSYTMIRATRDAGNNSDYTAELPLNIYADKGLEFYFEVETATGNLVSLPKFFPAEHPYQIGISGNASDTGFLILSPGTEQSAEDDYIFSVSYFAIQDEINLETMKVYFDGKDVTDKAVITSNMVVLKLSNVKTGMHSAELRVRTNSGALLMTGKHQTMITSGRPVFEMPFPLNGDATFRSNIYSITKDDSTNVAVNDNDASLNMNLYSRSENAHRKGFWYDFKANMYRDSKQNELTQRYNRVTFDLEIPFLRVILGDYTPNYSSFNMNNSNVYGIHGILNYHFLKIMYSTGENRRAINNESMSTGTFARDMTAWRLELGSDKSKHTSFLWGLHFSKTRDDIESLNEASFRIFENADTLQTVFPEDNLVVGTDFTVFLPEQRSSLGGEVAFSLYNSNIIDGAFTLDEMEERFDTRDIELMGMKFELDPQKYKDLFIINENMQPYKPNKSSLAWKAFLRPYLLHNNINIEISETGAGFHSLSSNSLQNDIRKLIISDQINILNVAMINAGYNKNEDNLADQKSTTTTFDRYYGQLVLQYQDVTSLALSYDTSTNNGLNAETDVDEFEQKSVNMSVSADYNVKKMPVAPTRFNITYTNSNSTDELSNSYEINLNSINFTMLNKFLTLPLTTKLYYGMSISENEVLGTNYENSSNSIGLRGEFAMFNGKLVPYSDMKLVLLSGDEDQSFSYFNFGSKYTPWENTRLATNLRVKYYSNSTTDNKNYSEFNWTFYISQRF